MKFSIRPIEQKDKEDWVALWTGPDSYLEFYNSIDKVTDEATNATFSRFLDGKETVWAAVAVDQDNKLIGFATYLTHRNTWSVCDSLYLNDLFVHPSCRLGGVGRALIEFVYCKADKLGCAKTYWNTQFENHRAQLLYTKVGKKSGFLLYVRP